MDPIFFLGQAGMFVPILVSTQIWAGIGMGAIIYLAAIAGINPEMYEAAMIDGSSRFQNAIYITLPSIRPTITILFILSMARILQNGLEPVLLLHNSLTLSRAQTIELFVFTEGINRVQFSLGAAIGFFQNFIGFILVLLTNFTAQKISDQGLF